MAYYLKVDLLIFCKCVSDSKSKKVSTYISTLFVYRQLKNKVENDINKSKFNSSHVLYKIFSTQINVRLFLFLTRGRCETLYLHKLMMEANGVS